MIIPRENPLIPPIKVLASQTPGAGPSRIQLTPPTQPQALSQILGMVFLLLINFSLQDHKEGLEYMQLSAHASAGMSVICLFLDTIILL